MPNATTVVSSSNDLESVGISLSILLGVRISFKFQIQIQTQTQTTITQKLNNTKPYQKYKSNQKEVIFSKL
jgi:hypothetical protein